MVRAVGAIFALLLGALAFALAPHAFAAGGGASLAPILGTTQASGESAERILYFSSDVDVQTDGALVVTETIHVRALGIAINNGIYRDFPTRYERNGRAIRVGFELRDVERDGRPEPHRMEAVDDGVRIYIGDPRQRLSPGEYRYVIRYRTTGQLGFFANFDELYWNVTGNGWRLPIDHAEARVRLPEAAPFDRRAAYTGELGSTERDAEVAFEQPGQIIFRTTTALAESEGLTIAVAWRKGLVASTSAGGPNR